MIGKVYDLEKAVPKAEEFVEADAVMNWDNTLMIVTSDHSNSYMRLHEFMGQGELPASTTSEMTFGHRST